MKLLWLGYLVYSLGNCAMKLCIETGITSSKASSDQLDRACLCTVQGLVRGNNSGQGPGRGPDIQHGPWCRGPVATSPPTGPPRTDRLTHASHTTATRHAAGPSRAPTDHTPPPRGLFPYM